MSRKSDQLTSLLLLVQRMVQRHARRHSCAVRQMTVMQLEAMRFIKENEGVTMRQLSQYLGITPPSTTAIIDDLAKKKLIERQADEEDRRKIRLVISKIGDEQLTDCFADFVKRFDRSMKRLTDKEREQLVSLLLKIID